ncbi:MAG: DUF393 domain-containing protein [Myxococcales bacterium]|nr:DUF393 domain-containing protein [Myxococcales bacterium]
MLTVLYDGSCPICAREIAMYRRQTGSKSISWLDVTLIPDGEIPLDLSRETVLARFHVIDIDGTVSTGIAGFFTLWKALPKYRRLAYLLDIPPLLPFLEYGYTLFLYLRPVLQRLAFKPSCR